MSKPISWDDQRAFLAVLEEGSFSAAARRLGLSQPTVRARIESLEATLGTILFTRSVHGLTPTEQARSVGASARAMAHASDAFVRAASGDMAKPAGTVRISVSEFVGTAVIAPMLTRLAARHPAVAIELDLSNAGADLLEQQVDIAVRMFPPQQAALVAKKVAAIAVGFYAHRDYLAQHGMPATIEELAAHRLIGPDRSRADRALADRMLPQPGPGNFILRTDSHPAALAAARAGLGIAVVQQPIGDADDMLRRVLPGHDVAMLDTWIVTHENLRHVGRVRAVFDHLAAEFAAFGRA
ncbi:DNA-binding transcriptional LysR family regulator [Sphingopyxis panaciterrae]|uniref:LysR family transcriptional regulator n=1 Tax=Sphingopyxis panaciterrae TaxID=363841 RepID=UPI00141FF1BE|nr:LysR family transcriptional regulator [Sphingopyxis panaciterrae]NIJ38335.1 DNA-binding transcriptional LysR family regulator [Sphingopyxis panaciterrae]